MMEIKRERKKLPKGGDKNYLWDLELASQISKTELKIKTKIKKADIQAENKRTYLCNPRDGSF
jgi:hypothetical protein